MSGEFCKGLDQEDAKTGGRGDAERDPSQDQSTWLQAPDFSRKDEKIGSSFESPSLSYGVSPRLGVSVSLRLRQEISGCRLVDALRLSPNASYD